MTQKKKVKLQMSSMELIKKLRETTGSGIVDCKKALAENNDNLDAAVKWLRENGILKAQKKQDRETNEGVVSFYNHQDSSSFALSSANPPSTSSSLTSGSPDFPLCIGNKLSSACFL